jgi:hypothetical protein
LFERGAPAINRLRIEASCNGNRVAIEQFEILERLSKFW